jgi:hypothetical protein
MGSDEVELGVVKVIKGDGGRVLDVEDVEDVGVMFEI